MSYFKYVLLHNKVDLQHSLFEILPVHMLIFSNTCQYAIKSCIILALEQKKTGIIEISEKIGTPTAFTSKILQQLTKHKLISSGKGRGGGFYLNEDQYEKLTIKDIYEHFVGDEVLNKCLLGLKTCDAENPCPVHHIAREIKDKMVVMLAYKIKDLKDIGNIFI